MELDRSAVGGCGLIVVILVVVLVGVVLVPGLLSGLHDSKTDQVMAEATLTRAREQLEQTRAVNFENKFILWTAYLDQNGDGALLVLAVVVGALALAGGYWLGARRG